jgi:hypothetical protein
MIPKKIFLLIFIVAASAAIDCGEKETPVPTHTIFGTLTCTSVDPGNRVAWIKLVTAGGNLTDSSLYSSSCLFQGPGCDFSMMFVPEGEYTVYAFVDINGNTEEPALVPDSGDLVTFGKPLMLWSKTQVDFPDTAWHMMP